jgi:methionyl-tRNA synthetase
MVAKGDIYAGRYEGWYSVRDEAFYGEEELVEGEGDTKLSPQGTPVEWTVEESWFFRLSAYGDKLLELYEKQPDFIRPESRRNEIVELRQRRPVRSLDLAHQLRLGRAGPGSDRPCDVCVGRCAHQLSHRHCGYPDRRRAARPIFWPADLHIIGKDIVRFHTVYWPAFLMSAELPLPKRVFGHGFLLNKGEKMSKSVGNVIDPIGWRDLRRRSAALFPAARSELRPGWQLQPRGDRHALQCRSRQRPRQSGAALPQHHRQELRGRRCRSRAMRPTSSIWRSFCRA